MSKDIIMERELYNEPCSSEDESPSEAEIDEIMEEALLIAKNNKRRVDKYYLEELEKAISLCRSETPLIQR